VSDEKEKLLAALQATREGYAEEAILNQFLVDAYTGGGGFRNGQVPSVEAPYWGRAAYEYGESWYQEYQSGLPHYAHRKKGQAKQTWSHLTAFYGEDSAEYRDRIDNSVYNNLVEPIVSITHSYLTEEPPTREGLTPDLERWLPSVTPLRLSMDRFCASVLLRGQICGWLVTVADTPATDQGPSLATSKGPYLSMFWPQQVLDFDTDDDGRLVYVKLCTKHYLPRASFMEPKVPAHRYTMWYPDRWERYTVVEIPDEKGGEPKYEILPPEGGFNKLARVPATIFRWRDLLCDPVRGQPQILTVAQLARDLYNAESERRHLHRANAFNMLVMPGGADGAPDGGADVGPGNYLTETKDTQGISRFIGPSTGPFESYESLCGERKGDVYDAALIDRGVSKQQETAEARRLRFQRTNMMLRAGALALDEWERETLILVGMLQGASEESLQKITITRKRDYAVQQFSDTLEAVLKVNDLPMAPECLAEVVNRVVVDELLADLPDERREELRALNEKHAAEQAKAPPPAPPVPPPSSIPPAPPADPPAAPAEPAQGA
jgi:hypothetical protein